LTVPFGRVPLTLGLPLFTLVVTNAPSLSPHPSLTLLLQMNVSRAAQIALQQTLLVAENTGSWTSGTPTHLFAHPQLHPATPRTTVAHLRSLAPLRHHHHQRRQSPRHSTEIGGGRAATVADEVVQERTTMPLLTAACFRIPASNKRGISATQVLLPCALIPLIVKMFHWN
jgi:hypothetical protein